MCYSNLKKKQSEMNTFLNKYLKLIKINKYFCKINKCILLIGFCNIYKQLRKKKTDKKKVNTVTNSALNNVWTDNPNYKKTR